MVRLRKLLCHLWQCTSNTHSHLQIRILYSSHINKTMQLTNMQHYRYNISYLTQQSLIAIYNQWTHFGYCSVSCGKGHRTRTRTCKTGNCTLQLKSTKICNLPTCIKYGQWTPFSSCPITCNGPAIRIQSRSCMQGSCPQHSLSNTKPCDTLPTCRK